jgi:hypothetical protein
LLEITLAVAIMAMMALAIYRFVQTNVAAIRISSQQSLVDARYDALREILANQWQGLPPGNGAMSGENLKLNDRPRDEIKWMCGPGPGLLTRYAAGDYFVTMRLQPESKKNDHFEIGFLRKPKADQEITNAHESWIPLIQDVQSLQIRYFDPRLNVWLDKWTDTITLPRLVKVTIGRTDSAVAWETIIPLGRTPL